MVLGRMAEEEDWDQQGYWDETGQWVTGWVGDNGAWVHYCDWLQEAEQEAPVRSYSL